MYKQSVDLCHLSSGVTHLLPFGLLMLLYASDPLQKRKKKHQWSHVYCILHLPQVWSFNFLICSSFQLSNYWWGLEEHSPACYQHTILPCWLVKVLLWFILLIRQHHSYDHILLILPYPFFPWQSSYNLKLLLLILCCVILFV